MILADRRIIAWPTQSGAGGKACCTNPTGQLDRKRLAKSADDFDSACVRHLLAPCWRTTPAAPRHDLAARCAGIRRPRHALNAPGE
jgi:hypothetical protein